MQREFIRAEAAVGRAGTVPQHGGRPSVEPVSRSGDRATTWTLLQPHLIEGRPMATEETSERANPNPTPPPTVPRWSRPIALTTAVVFCISLVFPIVAAFVKDRESWPKWWGALDVIVAFVLAALVIALFGLTRDKVDTQAEHASHLAYRFLTHGLLAFCVVFMLLGTGSSGPIV
jgi:hypothetical protein